MHGVQHRVYAEALRAYLRCLFRPRSVGLISISSNLNSIAEAVAQILPLSDLSQKEIHGLSPTDGSFGYKAHDA